MPTKELTTIQKIEKNMFLPSDDAGITLTEAENEIRLRYQDCYTHWHDHPDKTDYQIISYLMTQHNVSRSQAYRDLTNIKYLLGNVKANSKEWLRFTVISMCKEAFQKARAKNDFVAMVLAADKIGKYGQVDQQDAEGINWDELPSPDFEPVGDVTVLQPSLHDPKIEERRAALRAKYRGTEIDVPFEEINDEQK